MDEISYQAGKRTAWLEVLHLCNYALGYSQETEVSYLLVEREAAVAALRALCEDFGDNDWTGDTSLVDVIENHLAAHLRE